MIDWSTFFSLSPLMLAGLIVHILNKVDTARRRKGFTMETFLRLNGIGYMVALILSTVGLLFLSGGIDLMPGVNRIVVAFMIGFGGGSMIRSLVAKPKQ